MTAFERPAFALVRAVSSRFDACLRTDSSATIDVERARAQHAAYVAALTAQSIVVEHVSPNDDHADGCFVEDTAVVGDGWALVTTPGAPSRRAEVIEVVPVVSRHGRIVRMEGEARLDGGDVLRVGDVYFVGLSERTNPAGVESLRSVAAAAKLEVRAVPVAAGLHLKSACTLVDPRSIVVAPACDPGLVRSLAETGCSVLEAPEEHGANVLALGDVVLVSASAPRTAGMLEARGVDVVVVDVSEIHKADGALTCLSLRVPPRNAWSA